MNLTEKLNTILADLQGAWTESALILGAILLLIVGLFRKSSLLIKLTFSLVLMLGLWLNITNTNSGLLLVDSIFSNQLSSTFGSLFLIAAFLLVIFPRDKKHAAEFYFFILSMLIGSLFMMKANSLLMIYLSIELVSFASYILTNFTFKKKAFEAGIKYLLLGAISSAFMLFGLGLIYGSTGVVAISELADLGSVESITITGVLMMLLGIFFKISLAPSHIWVPATYQCAPVDATAFMSIVPKLAGLVLLKRILSFSVFQEHWMLEVVLILGILTIVIGTLGAFQQANARRMVSFGAIAHTGFLLPFAVLDFSTSNDAFWFYAVVYALMNLAVFYVLDQYERKNIENVSDYGETSKKVWMGAAFAFILVSLVGLPPLSGFFAKFFLFSTLWESYIITDSGILLWYLAVAVFATVGSLFYYLQIPKQIFLAKGETNQSINFSLSAKIIATLFSIGLLLLFFAPKLVIVMQQLLNNVHE